MIYLKTPEEIALLRASNQLVGKTLAEVAKYIKVGVTTLELDKIAEDFIRTNGAVPGFLGYGGFPNTLCVSVNDQVVHGIPSNYALKEGDIVAKKAYLQSADIIFKTMNNGSDSMKDISERIDKALSDVEKKLPVNNSYIETQTKCKVLSSTMQHFYDIIQDEKYASYTPENKEMYTQIMTEIGSLIDKELSISATDGKTIQMVKADMGMVRFCQYMFAYTSEEYDDAMEYMRMVQKLRPSYYWLYGYELGMAELQSGKPSQARALAENMLEQNIENGDAYALHSAIDRLAGNQEKAIEWADKGIALIPENAELYRYKAMSLCVMGDYEKAKTEIDKAIEIQEYPLAYMVSIIIETELGNNDTARTYQKTLEMQGVSLTDKMNKYLKGEITAEKLFTEGTGDVE